jgi:hypothetical protein
MVSQSNGVTKLRLWCGYGFTKLRLWSYKVMVTSAEESNGYGVRELR